MLSCFSIPNAVLTFIFKLANNFKNFFQDRLEIGANLLVQGVGLSRIFHRGANLAKIRLRTFCCLQIGFPFGDSDNLAQSE